jgi:hypothetical protein
LSPIQEEIQQKQQLKKNLGNGISIARINGKAYGVHDIMLSAGKIYHE